MRVFVLLSLALLAGCLAPTAEVAPAELPALPEALSPLGYLCPGESGDAAAEPCVTRLAKADATLQEPFIAVHPTNPQVVAVGVNLGPSLVERALGLVSQDSWVCRLGIFVSEDGGATWRETHAPTPEIATGPLGPEPTSCAGDPAIVFDDEGRMHVTGIATRGSALSPLAGDGIGFQTYYVRSDDLGATWVDAAIPSPNGMSQDRNWMAWDAERRIVYVVWQNTDGPFSEWTTEVAWSEDGGATWRTQDEAQRLVCGTPGIFAFHDGDVLYSCATVTEEGKNRVYVAEFDPDSGAGTVRSTLNVAGYWPHVVARADGSLVLRYALETGDEALLVSPDGGRTWGQPTELRALVAGAWGSAEALWEIADPSGGYHMIVRLVRATGPVADYELRHVVLDRDLALAHEATLSAWSTTTPPTPRSAQTLGDHYHGIAWTGTSALLVWAQDAALGLTEAVALPTA